MNDSFDCNFIVQNLTYLTSFGTEI